MPAEHSALLRIFLTALVLLLSQAAQAAPQPAQAKTKARASRGLVPPPPPYMPSILPELAQGEKGKEKTPEEKRRDRLVKHIKKYIYTKQGFEDPLPVKPNRHVTYWNWNVAKNPQTPKSN